MTYILYIIGTYIGCMLYLLYNYSLIGVVIMYICFIVSKST